MKELNLIPPKYKKQKQAAQLRIATFTVVGLLAALMILGVFLTRQIKQDLIAEKASWQEKIASTAVFGEAGRQLDYIKSLCDQRVNTAREMNTSGLDVPGLMRHVEQAAPSGLAIVDMNATTDQDGNAIITLDGAVKQESDGARFIFNLEKDAFFDTVAMASLSKIQSKGNDGLFAIKVNLTINSGK